MKAAPRGLRNNPINIYGLLDSHAPLKSPIMLSEGLATAIQRGHRTWQKPDAKPHL